MVVGLNLEWINAFYLLTGNRHIAKAIPHETKKQETIKKYSHGYGLIYSTDYL